MTRKSVIYAALVAALLLGAYGWKIHAEKERLAAMLEQAAAQGSLRGWVEPVRAGVATFEEDRDEVRIHSDKSGMNVFVVDSTLPADERAALEELRALSRAKNEAGQ